MFIHLLSLCYLFQGFIYLFPNKNNNERRKTTPFIKAPFQEHALKTGNFLQNANAQTQNRPRLQIQVQVLITIRAQSKPHLSNTFRVKP